MKLRLLIFFLITSLISCSQTDKYVGEYIFNQNSGAVQQGIMALNGIYFASFSVGEFAVRASVTQEAYSVKMQEACQIDINCIYMLLFFLISVFTNCSFSAIPAMSALSTSPLLFALPLMFAITSLLHLRVQHPQNP